ncbi:MAG: 23S rRNA (adenine(1618)-N(6))-methyltransferase RlmF [Bacteriovoracaceae bacterium]|jgi:23S rRNA (adenine1618-N6)-methyltransferase|nr:23S rRNA (adenine(1618)-N(6))-methyltransferase RlmF [Bacteriovoracaceae bacterium]
MLDRSMVKKVKSGLHTRNHHKERYDFTQLVAASPALSSFVKKNRYKDLSIDFSNPEAVLELNKSLLAYFYKVENWKIPSGYLCPPIPGRADTIHYLADLLSRSNGGKIPEGRHLRGLDIGVGANCIYPILGTRLYGWEFLGIDIDRNSIKAAKALVKSNPLLRGRIKLQFQKNPRNIFNETLPAKELFDFTICNPPFHSSAKDAAKGTEEKVKSLEKSKAPLDQKRLTDADKKVTNFGGKNSELWCPGGEAAFIKRMIKQSVGVGKNIFWFTTLVSKKENLPRIYEKLKEVNALDVQTIEMSQGNKRSRLVAWTFLTKKQQQMWCTTHWKKSHGVK